MKKCKVFLLVFFLIYLCSDIIGQGSFIDLTKNGKFPHTEFIDEEYMCATYLAPYIYVGTTPNGHIFKINPKDVLRPRRIWDIALLPSNGNKRAPMRGITNDGTNLFAATSFDCGLYYINPNTGAKTRMVNQDSIFYNRGIYMILQPVIYKSTNYEYIFFPCISSDWKFRLIRWKVNKVNGVYTPTVNDQIDIILLNLPASWEIPDHFTNIIQLSKSYSYSDVLILGTTQNKIVSYDILGGYSNYFDINYSDIITNIIVASPGMPGYVWLFTNRDSDNRAIKYSLQNSVLFTPGLSIGKPNDDAAHFLYNNSKIYTYSHVIDVNSNTAGPYSGDGAMTGRDLMVVGSHVYGISKWASNPAYLDSANLTTYLSAQIDYGIKTTPESPNFGNYGGPVITSLTASQNYAFGNQAIGYPVFVHSPISSNWENINIPTGLAQADYLLAYSNKLFGGFYNGAKFFSRNISNYTDPWTESILPTSVNGEQLRIISMDTWNNYIYFATTGRDACNNHHSNPAICRYNINDGNITHIATINSTSISNISIRPRPELMAVDIYGTASCDGVFLYRDSFEAIPQEIPTITPNSNFNAVNILVHNNSLIFLYNASTGAYLRKYIGFPQSNAEFTNPPPGVSFTDYLINSGREFAETQLYKANENNKVLFSYNINDWSSGHLRNFWSTLAYINNASTLTIQNLYSVNTNDERQKIYKISPDRGNPNNYDIYTVFFKGGILRRYHFSYEIIPIPDSKLTISNFPNPFNPSTKISYSVIDNGRVSMTMFNTLGEKVADLVNSEMNQGTYEVDFNGSGYASGIYICRLQNNNLVTQSKLLLLK